MTNNDGNNTSKDIAEFRDFWFSNPNTQREFDEAMKNPKEQLVQQKLSKYSAEKLYTKALSLIEDLGKGNYSDAEVRATGIQISHCLSAIKDAVLLPSNRCVLESNTELELEQ